MFFFPVWQMQNSCCSKVVQCITFIYRFGNVYIKKTVTKTCPNSLSNLFDGTVVISLNKLYPFLNPSTVLPLLAISDNFSLIF